MTKIHPTAILEGNIQLGENVEIGAFCYLKGDLEIGDNVRISPHCSIGTPAEHKIRPTEIGKICIGNDTIIRDGCVIQRGTGYYDTTIGNHCFIMNKCYISHDTRIGNHVTMAAHTALGGRTTVLEGATFGLGVLAHQVSTIGAWAMVGMGAVVAKDVPPFALVLGNPMRFQRFNSYHFPKFGIEIEKNIYFKDHKIYIDKKHSTLIDLYQQFQSISSRKKIVEIVEF
jgi:UDP-N-acetylglucosamine acyltransferase